MSTKPSKVTYGWRRDASGQLVEVPEQQEAINNIIRWSVSGWTDQMVADELNSEGVESRTGKPWSRSMVANVRAKHEERAPAIREERQNAVDQHSNSLVDQLNEELDREEREDGLLYEYYVYDKHEDALVAKEARSVPTGFMEKKSAEAIQELREREGSKTFRFYDPLNQPALSRASSVDPFVERLANEGVGKDAHRAVDEITGQKDVKQNVRRQLNALLREVAVMYQENLALRQQLADLKEAKAETES